ncbi:MAG: hypothetical protein ACJAVE_001207 [Polaribacter sp.]|jgi:hypothetical protein|tara:strand:+ start:260 stop:841 length:582 start_codon:yes stop_codon:yes gene_type:complete
MKSTIKKYLVVVMMLGTLINYANENKNSLNTIDGRRVKVEFKTVKKGHTLSIKDESGIVMYSQEIIKPGNYSQIFDLSKLQKGNYTTELEKDFEITIKSFSVLDGQILFKDEKTIFKPVVRIKDNLILISKMNFEKEPLKVVLYYNDEIILSENTTDSSDIINRVYRLSKKIKGNYKVIVKTDNRTYKKDFNF